MPLHTRMRKKPFLLWGISLLAMLLSALSVPLLGVIPAASIAVSMLLQTAMTLIYLRGYRGEEIAVTPATVQAAIATLARPGSYARTLYTELFWSGGSRADELDVWVRGENTRIVIRGGDEEKNILLRADGTWLWYTGADGAYRGPARTGDSDAWQTLLRYEDILSADPDDITDAGYTDFGGEHCIYARWRAGELGYESLCYVSVDTGLLMGLQTYDGEILIYSMHSSEPDISTPDDDLFEPPSEEQ